MSPALPADMDGPQLSKSSRTFSASALRERLSNLTTSPLRPVVALHASIELNTTKTQATDPRRRLLVYLAFGLHVPLSLPLVRPVYGVSLHRAQRQVTRRPSSIPALWPFIAVYIVWMRWIDKSPEHGTRLSPWFRSLIIWKYFAEYYPAS
ncbi:hypothetical protein ID866_4918 [Astraeus odoratus]|nr:hypothetical protein ID866_4918 [Astraeus odoratus]